MGLKTVHPCTVLKPAADTDVRPKQIVRVFAYAKTRCPRMYKDVHSWADVLPD